MATSVDSSPIVVSASVIGIPALTNTDSCRVKFIKFFFFAFSFVSSKSNIPFDSSMRIGKRFFSTSIVRAVPRVSALVVPSISAPVASIAEYANFGISVFRRSGSEQGLHDLVDGRDVVFDELHGLAQHRPHALRDRQAAQLGRDPE